MAHGTEVVLDVGIWNLEAGMRILFKDCKREVLWVRCEWCHSALELGRGLLSGKVQSLLPKTSQAARALALRAPDAVAMCSENCLVAFDATFDALPPEPILSEP